VRVQAWVRSVRGVKRNRSINGLSLSSGPLCAPTSLPRTSMDVHKGLETRQNREKFGQGCSGKIVD
jgi:hypothetical protein